MSLKARDPLIMNHRVEARDVISYFDGKYGVTENEEEMQSAWYRAMRSAYG